MATVSKRGGLVEHAGLMPWAPVWMSLGIGLWFALPVQPGLLSNALAAIPAIMGGSLWFFRKPVAAERARLLGFALLFLSAGFLLTSMRAGYVDGPVLRFRYYGPIEGRVIKIDRSARDRIRITLDQPRLTRIPPERIPRKLRVSLPAGVTAKPPPGTRVMLTGHLGPPPGPAEPGGFDFRRAAWFQGLGAIGYARTPVLIVEPAQDGGAMRLHRLRMSISAEIQRRIGGQAGAVAAALMTGDRSGIAEATNRMMRDANLYHIISISGLHMGMLAGFVFAALRIVIVGFQAITRRALTLPAHRLAAFGAILAAAAYLWLSGGGVATERAFLMVTVMLGAVICGRRALSLRTVALAATIILALAPEALLTPGFQMSFAATVALILIYPPWQRWGRVLPWFLRPVLMLLVTSLVAGAATAPIAAAHFSRLAHYGVLANLLVIPVTGTLIMPMGAVAAVLAPVGLADPALLVMRLGTQWMLLVGEWVASLDGAVSNVVQPGRWVLPLIGFGAVVSVLSRKDRPAWRNLRWLPGMALIGFGFLSWQQALRPALLISREGDAVGLVTEQGRAVSKPKGGAFAVQKWLEKDGDSASQVEAASRTAWHGPAKQRAASFGEAQVIHLTGKGAEMAARELCRPAHIIVSNQPLPPLQGGCEVFDATRLRRSGAISLRFDNGLLRVDSVAQRTGRRPWAHDR
ncbi:ComEC/Rec2 family competence protein [Paracoccus sp. SCSIO 75233]|uniref:ComEC/Rec2 family competence protein n=1 Tax=Paracoccus sp. SCSIO 75233 TaxID=3017782 RepID=UPI0022F0A8F3|nr:ComEC/Rec2 family competence protein [Paracoccus sp. SCSIO 75233]WBU52137.1 ComEC/Rec2 family competence protein [Paracoccus sp. SCSIO 75233]